jgi:hypothetical protein
MLNEKLSATDQLCRTAEKDVTFPSD